MVKQVIMFHYELKDEKGKMIESSRKGDPLAFLEGSGSIIPGLEKELMNMQKGDVKDVHVAYPQAYGKYDDNLVAKVPRSQFPKQDLKEGDLFQIKKGDAVHVVAVIEIGEDTVTIDANHPLAGKDLYFHVELTGRRDATDEEISHGHIHGPGGHHH